MNAKGYINWMKLFVGLALLAGVLFYLYSHYDDYSKFIQFSPFHITLFITLHLINHIFLGKLHQVALKSEGIDLTFQEWFGVNSLACSFNQILPAKGGTFFRWFYLRKAKNISFNLFFSLLSFTTILGMIGTGLSGALLLVIIKYDTWAVPFLVLMFLGIFLGLSLPFVRKRILSKVALTVFLYFVGISLLYPLKTYVAFSSLGVELSLTDSLVLSMLNLFVSLLPLLPNNFGLKEILLGKAATLYALKTELGMMAVLLERGTLLLFVLPLGLIYFKILISPLIKGWRDLKIPLFNPGAWKGVS